MRKINFLLVCTSLLIACENASDSSIKQMEKIQAQIPEGQYESTETHNLSGKTKAGKILATITQFADDQINLADNITVIGSKIISNTVTGKKEVELTRSGTNDSLFFADLSTVGGVTKQITIKLTKESHLIIETDKKRREYKPR